MTLPTHVALSLIIGKLTGNYTLAITSSVMPDLDHLNSYIKNGVIKSPKKFWQTITSADDPFGDQRGILHNILIFIPISIAILSYTKLGITLVLGWLGHITLDTLDNSDYWPFYPNKKINFKGPIKYNSKNELLIFASLITIWLII